MQTQEILKKVRQIEIKTKGLSRHLFSGAYHSHFKGRGMSFSEVREYQQGDDIRYIDWNVTARSGQTQVKVFEEERELTLFLMVDISKSMYFGSQHRDKFSWLTEIAAVLAFSATQNNDKVGMILFSDVIHLYIPPKKGRQHILRMIRELLVFRPDSMKTRFDLPLQYLNRVQSKRTIAFLLSDFYDPIPEAILKIVSRRHDLIGIQLREPLELQMPPLGLMCFRDLETGKEILVDSSATGWIETWQKQNEAHTLKTRQCFHRAHADYIELPLDDSYVKTLLHFFKRRS